MVTRLSASLQVMYNRSVLAKIHMVTKHKIGYGLFSFKVCSVLAKIHMVTKPVNTSVNFSRSSVLAKIHMVTKPHFVHFLLT